MIQTAINQSPTSPAIKIVRRVKKVDPLRSLAQIDMIKREIWDNPRDLGLFIFGINTALRASDLCKLTRNDVRHLQPGDYLTIKQQKTGDNLEIILNTEAWQAIQPLLEDPREGALFCNVKDGVSRLTEEHICDLVQKWTRDCRIKGRYGSHTLRKTWGYIQRTVYKTPWEIISRALGHTDLMVTMRYLGITPEEVRQAFMRGI